MGTKKKAASAKTLCEMDPKDIILQGRIRIPLPPGAVARLTTTHR